MAAPAFRGLRLAGLALLCALPGVLQAGVILDWNPSLAELPSAEYDHRVLGFDPAAWHAELTFGSQVRDVYVAAPLHSTPYAPVVEYDARQDDFSASFDFYSPGLYASRTVFIDPDVEDHIEFFYVGAAAAKKGTVRQSRPQEIVQPFVADIILVEEPNEETGESSEGAIDAAVGVIDGEERVSTVAEAITKIKDAADKKGAPITVELVGHGAGGVISVGAGTAPQGKFAGAELYDFSAATQQFIEALKGKVSSLILKGCSVAEGVDDPGRTHLMETLADGLGATVYAWDDEIIWNSGSLFRSGHASVDVHGARKFREPATVPEPPTWLMLGSLLLVAFVCQRLRAVPAQIGVAAPTAAGVSDRFGGASPTRGSGATARRAGRLGIADEARVAA